MIKIVTLTTDFGVSDPWVGIMKGVMLSIDPHIKFVDISHSIPPQDILGGALCLKALGNNFPEGTVHLAVVDPGVGSNRDPVIIKTRRYYYVGPNNGLFSFLDSKIEKVVKITNMKMLNPNISVTFHGRDVFAPVAAKLFSTDMAKFGKPVEIVERIETPQPVVEEDRIRGEITHIDHFGNLFTNIPGDMVHHFISSSSADSVVLELAGKSISGLSYYYRSVEEGCLGAIINSLGFVEFFTPNADASVIFKLGLGDPVSVKLLEK